MITGILKQLKEMHHSMVFTNSTSLLKVKDKWCHNHKFRDKVSRQKKVAKGSILIQLKLPKDQWVIKVGMLNKKSKDHHKLICFKSTKEVNLHKIKQCNRTIKLNKGHRCKILETVSKIWIQIVISIKFHLKNQQLTKIKVFRGLQLKLRNLQQLDLGLPLRLIIKLNRIKL